MTGVREDGVLPWYRSWFGEEYLHLYPHRNREEAREAVALLLRELGRRRVLNWPEGSPPAGLPEPGHLPPPLPGAWQVLDLGCGAGRHLRALAGGGFSPSRTVGMDLSAPLLREAGRAVPDCPRIRGDMRHLPFQDGSFDLVTSFFTSFGYFEAEDEDLGVLLEIQRILRPGGWVLLDFLNADQVRATLTPCDTRTVGGKRVDQERRLVDGGRRVEKRIRIRGEGVEEDFVERVRLYDADDLDALFQRAGLEVEARFGDYDGVPPSRTAPRQILLARRG